MRASSDATTNAGGKRATVAAFRCGACRKVSRVWYTSCPRCDRTNGLSETRIPQDEFAVHAAEEAPGRRRIFSLEEIVNRREKDGHDDVLEPFDPWEAWEDPDDDDDDDERHGGGGDDDDDDDDGLGGGGSLKRDGRNRRLVDDGAGVTFSRVREDELAVRPCGIESIDEIASDEGGLIEGFSYLVGGDPGVGKSRILSQIAVGILEKHRDAIITYGAAEETAKLIKRRFRKMGLLSRVEKAGDRRFGLKPGSDADALFRYHLERRGNVLVLDSVQEYGLANFPGAPGSLQQTYEVCRRATRVASRTGTIVLLVSQVNGGSQLAGLRKLQHAVGAIVYMRTDKGKKVPRALRGTVVVEVVKNRDGKKAEARLAWEQEGPRAGQLASYDPERHGHEEGSREEKERMRGRERERVPPPPARSSRARVSRRR